MLRGHVHVRHARHLHTDTCIAVAVARSIPCQRRQSHRLRSTLLAQEVPQLGELVMGELTRIGCLDQLLQLLLR